MIGDRDVTDLPPRKRQIAMVFQSYAVFPHMTVFDNIGFGLRMQHRPASEIKSTGREGGRVCCNWSRTWVAFQPSSAVASVSAWPWRGPLSWSRPSCSWTSRSPTLTRCLRLQFRAELKKLVQEIQTTTIYVTHDQVEALSLGDRIAVMRSGQHFAGRSGR